MNFFGQERLVLALITLAMAGCGNLGVRYSAKQGSKVSTVPMSLGNLAKSWAMGACVPGSEPISGATQFKSRLTFTQDGNYSYGQDWYSGAGCVPANQLISYEVSGKYTIGEVVTGAEELQRVSFTIELSSLIAFSLNVQSRVDSSCGVTSPYNPPKSPLNGIPVPSNLMVCSGVVLPSSTNIGGQNVASFDGRTLGLGAVYFGIPGVFNGSAVPTAASLFFY